MATILYYDLKGEITISEGYDRELEESLYRELQDYNLGREIKDDVLSRFGRTLKYKARDAVFGNNLKEYEITDLKIDITFSRGSVIATGIVIINVVGQISGALSFIEYIGKAIQFLAEKKIKNRFDYSIPSLNVQFKGAEELSNQDHQKYDSPFQKKINPFSILSYLTFINAVLILGGTIFGSFQIKSIRDNFEESSRILNETKLHYYEKLDSLQRDVNEAHNQLLSKIDKIDLNINTADSLKEIQLQKVRHSFYEIETKADDLQQSINKQSANLEQITINLEKLKAKKIEFSLYDVWVNSDKGIIAFIFIVVVIAVAGLIKAFRKRWY